MYDQLIHDKVARKINGEIQSPQIMMLKTLDLHMQKKLEPHLTAVTEICLKGIKGFNIMPETVKLQEENTQKHSWTLGLTINYRNFSKSTRN